MLAEVAQIFQSLEYENAEPENGILVLYDLLHKEKTRNESLAEYLESVMVTLDQTINEKDNIGRNTLRNASGIRKSTI